MDENCLLVKQAKFLSKHFKAIAAGDFLQRLRSKKTDEEVDRIRKACRIKKAYSSTGT